MSLDLHKLENKLDEALSNETSETLNKFLNNKRMTNNKQQMTTMEIKTLKDLPPYGKYVLVNGIDEKQYGTRQWHVCEMNDLEDGIDFEENGIFHWLTEKGTRITQVTHWAELPILTN